MIIEQKRFDVLIKISEVLSPTPEGPENYWRTLLTQSFIKPETLTPPQIFELGRFCERMLRFASDNEEDYDVMTVIGSSRTVQSKIEENWKSYEYIKPRNDVKEDFSYKKLVIFTDSQLVFRQLKGEYKVRNKNLKPLHSQAIFAMVAAKAFLRWHPRDDGDGPIADKLANRAVGGNRGTRHRSEMDAAGHRTDASGEVGKGGAPSNTSAEDDKR